VQNENQAVAAAGRIGALDRDRIRAEFDRRFTAQHMAQNYLKLYSRLAKARRTGTGRLGASPGIQAESRAHFSGLFDNISFGHSRRRSSRRRPADIQRRTLSRSLVGLTLGFNCNSDTEEGVTGEWRGWGAFAALGIIWGLPYFFIKLSVQELSPVVWPSDE